MIRKIVGHKIFVTNFAWIYFISTDELPDILIDRIVIRLIFIKCRHPFHTTFCLYEKHTRF
ncbi:Hypothetical protein HEAR2346 [Herminiimonas arsenicoxydans]|uniref:Uncharacterized protein n=1 Tax=Herminiimonas arsenicoxydans TaxID=204773 RepID=A4G7J0_HERAR|nr:Hypothetical protein HEAR2346 [Herminiimonas arsenicoxydans]